MSEPGTSRTGYGLRAVFPTLFGLTMAVMGAVPWDIPNVPTIAPFLTLMAVFYWSSERPSLMPPLAVFFIGLWNDILIGLPLGMTPLLLLIVRTVVVEQNVFVFSQSVVLGWLGYGTVATGVVILSWLIGSWWQGATLPLRPFAVQWLLSVLIYPLVAEVFRWCNLLLYRRYRG